MDTLERAQNLLSIESPASSARAIGLCLLDIARTLREINERSKRYDEGDNS